MFGRSEDDEKLRERLQSNDASAAGGAAGGGSAADANRAGRGQAVHADTKGKDFVGPANLGYAGIYSPSAMKTLYGFKFIFLILGFVGGYVGGLVTDAPLLCLPIGCYWGFSCR